MKENKAEFKINYLSKTEFYNKFLHGETIIDLRERVFHILFILSKKKKSKSKKNIYIYTTQSFYFPFCLFSNLKIF